MAKRLIEYMNNRWFDVHSDNWAVRREEELRTLRYRQFTIRELQLMRRNGAN